MNVAAAAFPSVGGRAASGHCSDATAGRSFDLTNDFRGLIVEDMSGDVDEVIRAYPQIYLACHVDHRTRSTSAAGITSREASFLTHIGEDGASPAALARHIGIRPSTLSAALAGLERRGLVTIERDTADGRRRRVRLTAAGRGAITADSVLDEGRVAAMLDAMDADDRARAIEGLGLLAAAARRLGDREPG